MKGLVGKLLHGRRILLVHPDNADLEVMRSQLQHAGLSAESVWPYPAYLPADRSISVVLAETANLTSAIELLDRYQWPALLVLASERSGILDAVMAANCHGALVRPVRASGFVLQLAMAAMMHAQLKRLEGRLAHVEGNLRARRTIEKAVRAIAETQGLDPDEAFATLRRRAMKQRISVSELAQTIVATAS